jgi:hypothetical protein
MTSWFLSFYSKNIKLSETKEQQSEIHFIAKNVMKGTYGHLQYQKFSRGRNTGTPLLRGHV